LEWSGPCQRSLTSPGKNRNNCGKEKSIRVSSSIRNLLIIAGIVAALAAMVIIPIQNRRHDIEKVRGALQVGMSISDLLKGTQGCLMIQVIPEGQDDAPPDGATCSSTGEYYLGAGQSVAELEFEHHLQDRLREGRDLRLSFTYTAAFSRKYSFGVTLGADGKVKKVSQTLNSWD
jgi:hypothetical protein